MPSFSAMRLVNSPLGTFLPPSKAQPGIGQWWVDALPLSTLTRSDLPTLQASLGTALPAGKVSKLLGQDNC